MPCSVHDETLAEVSAVGKRKLTTLWRTLILSCTQKTLFPYALWIRILRLSNLRETLSDLAPYPSLRDAFFNGDMAGFSIVDDNSKLTRQNRPRLNIQAITASVGDTITAFVKDAAERENKSVALAHLEDEYIPMGVLHMWVSRLSTLVAISTRDGSVMGPRVAAAIRDHCPNFRELSCFYCDGPTVDADLAGFFQTLRPNTLKTFKVLSRHRLSGEAFEALGHHSSSLQSLHLGNLSAQALEHLGQLRRCTALRSLILNGDSLLNLHWEAEYNNAFLDAVSWLSSCSSLESLLISGIPDVSTLLGHVLKVPTFRLVDLSVELRDDNEAFYTSLANQTSLWTLSLKRDYDLPDLPAKINAQFIQSLMKCRSLTKLNLMTQTTLTAMNLTAMSQSLPHLEDILLEIDELSDDVFDPLSAMPHLRTLNFMSPSTFSFEGILGFINRLATGGPARRNFGLVISNQVGFKKFSPGEEDILTQQLASTVGGRFEIQYLGDPEEDHESDFSD